MWRRISPMPLRAGRQRLFQFEIEAGFLCGAGAFGAPAGFAGTPGHQGAQRGEQTADPRGPAGDRVGLFCGLAHEATEPVPGVGRDLDIGSHPVGALGGAPGWRVGFRAAAGQCGRIGFRVERRRIAGHRHRHRIEVFERAIGVAQRGGLVDVRTVAIPRVGPARHTVGVVLRC